MEGVVRLNAALETRRGRNSTAAERREFINWLFDHISEFHATSKRELTTMSIGRYDNETGIHINKDWVYTIIRLDVFRDSEGIKFEVKCPYTFDELCERPSLIRELMRR